MIRDRFLAVIQLSLLLWVCRSYWVFKTSPGSWKEPPFVVWPAWSSDTLSMGAWNAVHRRLKWCVPAPVDKQQPHTAAEEARAANSYRHGRCVALREANGSPGFPLRMNDYSISTCYLSFTQENSKCGGRGAHFSKNRKLLYAGRLKQMNAWKKKNRTKMFKKLKLKKMWKYWWRNVSIAGKRVLKCGGRAAAAYKFDCRWWRGRKEEKERHIRKTNPWEPSRATRTVHAPWQFIWRRKICFSLKPKMLFARLSMTSSSERTPGFMPCLHQTSSMINHASMLSDKTAI